MRAADAHPENRVLPPVFRSTHDAADAVLLVSPDRWLCQALSRELAWIERWWFLEFPSLTDARRAVDARAPGALAVVDVGLGGGDDPGAVVDLVGALRRHGWRHIVTVGNGADLDGVTSILEAGAHAYLVVGEHIRMGLADHHLPPSRRAAGESFASTSWDRALAPRGVEVVALAAGGYTNRDIGRALGMSTETVKSHLASMTRRFGARDRAHLVLLAMRSGTIS